MYSQHFTLCYCLVKSPLLSIRCQNLFTSQVSYAIGLSGASPPKKHPGSAHELTKENGNKLQQYSETCIRRTPY